MEPVMPDRRDVATSRCLSSDGEGTERAGRGRLVPLQGAGWVRPVARQVDRLAHRLEDELDGPVATTAGVAETTTIG
jgi:hypothetical protein